MNATLRMVLLTLATASSVATAQTAPPQTPRIVTSGEAQARVTPDRATVFIGVQTRGATAAAAGNENAKRQKAILDTLKVLGLGPDQLMTQNYSVSPEVRYDPPGNTPRVTGYTVSNTVRVELRRIDQVGSVIDAALAKGANQIGGIQFSASNAADVRRVAMADAVKDARADAEVLAKAAGGSLGILLELTSSSPGYQPVFRGAMEAQMAKMAQAPTPIEAGEQTISATVSAVWQFIPGVK